MQCTPEQRKITTSYSTTVATTTRGDTAVNYEEVTNLHGNKPSTSNTIVDTPAALAESQLGTDV